MAAYRTYIALLAATIVSACLAVPAAAADQIWNGRYSLALYAAQKTGTSMAARQPEPDFRDEYVFVTNCVRGQCVATAIGGSRPKNHTLPRVPRYTWDGTRWVHVYDWQWDCYLGDGVPKVWVPARSLAYYVPQRDGSLRGSLSTDIYGGPCDGTIEIPVAAYPVW